ncbi:AAA family ATPase [Nocardia sp. NPDC049190]|uniref:helix-turn-helix transcriptional regulator n=1 Tax=Nocardia sp. NPDC049190 TaxID=3155650 RepID=UPI00340B9446
MQPSGVPAGGPAVELVGRRDELAILDRLVDAVRAGASRALVVRGEPGVGKTALLEYVARSAAQCRIARTAGVQAEMELAFAGVHQLCLPMLDRLERLPTPQRSALSTAFGMTAGPAPDRFLVGLAVLNILSDVAEERPLLCLVDDEQWLDRASAQVLAFVARRLGAESVGLVFAASEPSEALAGLSTLVVRGLRTVEARVLLDAVSTGPLDPRVRDQIVAETRGNPLALLEVPHGLTAEELAGGFGLPGAVRLSADIEATFRARIDALPDRARRLLLLAAAESTGDSALLWRAADRLGIGPEAATPAVEADLAAFTTRVRFRHPLVRSAAYRSGSLRDRQQAHRALAEVTDPQLDPDRRAWHRAHAASGPDDDVAAELARSAGRAQARGGVGAAAAFLARAATLTVDPAQRAERALGAAAAKIQAGAFDGALDLLAMAETESLSDFQRARAEVLRARLAFVSSRGSAAAPLLLQAAQRLESIDIAESRATYLDAMLAAMFAGRLAVGASVLEVARAAASAPRPHGAPGPPDLLLDWLTTHYNEGYVLAVPALRSALAAFDDDMPAAEQLRLALFAATAAYSAWDDERLHLLTRRYVELARATGAITDVPVALSAHGVALLFEGDLLGAAAVVEELQAAQDATGSSLAPYAALGLAALRGERDKTSALIESTVREVTTRGEGNGISVARWAESVLYNGIGDYRKALDAAQLAAAFAPELAATNWALVELVEAAVRGGASEVAAAALSRLGEMTGASGTEWALGVGARSRALLSAGATAEHLYRESIVRLDRTRMRAELARAHLVYGEWLRRERRRTDARGQLRTAHDLFAAMGMTAFAERARRELNATGDTMRKSAHAVDDKQLTAQEAQVARLARAGMSNPEIGARLFISARTVQYHLSKVFAKLGISSRGQLDRALPAEQAG